MLLIWSQAIFVMWDPYKTSQRETDPFLETTTPNFKLTIQFSSTLMLSTTVFAYFVNADVSIIIEISLLSRSMR